HPDHLDVVEDLVTDLLDQLLRQIKQKAPVTVGESRLAAVLLPLDERPQLVDPAREGKARLHTIQGSEVSGHRIVEVRAHHSLHLGDDALLLLLVDVQEAGKERLAHRTVDWPMKHAVANLTGIGPSDDFVD